ncbi:MULTISPECIES: helix-turn-helix domain-containing protein [Lysobacter]|uniref:helix-turn-helix domain-containing protein n=1 Tax=Lysobacter TaxID=68 RepID=UPI0004CFFB0D|nr:MULTISPECIES: XRE family transcriptional regulator [Lysobacter]
MTTLLDESSLQLARRIRLERETRGWSLADLAARSEVSKAAISKIERGETSPTAALLVRLAGAFDLTLAGLLLRAEGDAGRLSRADAQPVWRDPETGYRRKQVFVRPDHPIEIVEVEMPAGRRVCLPASSYARIRQAIRVIKGELSIVEGGESHRLQAGDCLGFGAPSDVTLANDTPRPCVYLVVLARS